MNDFDFQIKVVLLGNPAVGKSSILMRYVLGNCSTDSLNTVGAKYMAKLVSLDNSVIKLNIWDTAGQERYQSFSKLYCRDARAVILVYDVNDEETFGGMKKWYECMSRDVLPVDCSIFIAGNKSDLLEGKCKFIDQVKKYSEELSAPDWTVSAVTGENIEDLFRNIAEDAIPKMKADRNPSIHLTKEANAKALKKKRCC